MDTLPIYEVFDTFQGEGVHFGKHAFFIRTFGCPLHCPFCDSAGTWHLNYKPKAIPRVSVNTLVEAVKQSGADLVVITGGEPAVHDLKPLTGALQRKLPIRINLETSGAFELRGDFNWVTVSPKFCKLPCDQALELVNELKFIITKPEDIISWFNWFRTTCDRVNRIPFTKVFQNLTDIWLHPEWSKKDDPLILGGIVDAIKNESIEGISIRAGYQLHKLYNVDQLDNRSKADVPLGGNDERL
jgi:organic radical activating enzyme